MTETQIGGALVVGIIAFLILTSGQFNVRGRRGVASVVVLSLGVAIFTVFAIHWMANSPSYPGDKLGP